MVSFEMCEQLAQKSVVKYSTQNQQSPLDALEHLARVPPQGRELSSPGGWARNLQLINMKHVHKNMSLQLRAEF